LKLPVVLNTASVAKFLEHGASGECPCPSTAFSTSEFGAKRAEVLQTCLHPYPLHDSGFLILTLVELSDFCFQREIVVTLET